MKRLLNLFVFLILMFGGVACNLPKAAPGNPPTSGNSSQPNVVVITNTVALAPALPVETFTFTPSPTPTPQNPLVITTTLCWVGPGAKYDVVSALNQNERVEVIGRGSIDGWLIIRNPKYHDPCWVQTSALQIDAGFDMTSLQIYNPPPTNTNTPKPTKVPTPTP